MNKEELDENASKFKKFMQNAYNYQVCALNALKSNGVTANRILQEALDRQNLKQEDVDRLRQLIKGSQYVPQFIADKQVKFTAFVVKCEKIISVLSAFTVFERIQK